MARNCRHCDEPMRKFYPENATWTYPERDWTWLCQNVDCILDRWDSCDLFGHEETLDDDGHTVCRKCDKVLEENQHHPQQKT
jgi:hypothetical protein